MRISDLITLPKTSVSAADYVLTANTTTNTNAKFQLQNLFPTIANATGGGAGTQLCSAVTNKNEYTISRIVAANSTITIGGGGGTNDLTIAVNQCPTTSLTGTITNAQLAGSIDVTSKITGIVPTANGGTGSSSATYCSLTANVSGVLPVANGGTNINSFVSNRVFYAAGPSAMGQLPAASNGQILIGSSGTVPSWGLPTNTATITWTAGAASLEANVAALTGLTGDIQWAAGSDRTVSPANAAAADNLSIKAGNSTGANAGGNLFLYAGTGGAAAGSHIYLRSGTGTGKGGNIEFEQQDGATANFTKVMRLVDERCGISNNQAVPIVPAAQLDVNQSDAAGAVPTLKLTQADANVEILSVKGSGGTTTAFNLNTEPDGDTSAAQVAAPHSAAWTLKGMIRIKVDDGASVADRYIPYYLKV